MKKEGETSVRIYTALSSSLAAIIVSTAAIGQTAPSEIDSHIATAKAAAGLDFRGTFMALCVSNAPPGGGRGAAGRGPAPARGAINPMTARAAPDRATWYAS